MDCMYYTIVDKYSEGDEKYPTSLTIWRGTGILRPYSSVVNVDLYSMRIVSNGVIHYFRNEHSFYTDRMLRKFIVKWLKNEKYKQMEVLLNE